MPRISLGTVHRNHFPDGTKEIPSNWSQLVYPPFRYDTRPHQYVRCRVCGKSGDVIPVPTLPLRAFPLRASRSRKRVEYEGICEECARVS